MCNSKDSYWYFRLRTTHHHTIPYHTIGNKRACASVYQEQGNVIRTGNTRPLRIAWSCTPRQLKVRIIVNSLLRQHYIMPYPTMLTIFIALGVLCASIATRWLFLIKTATSKRSTVSKCDCEKDAPAPPWTQTTRRYPPTHPSKVCCRMYGVLMIRVGIWISWECTYGVGYDEMQRGLGVVLYSWILCIAEAWGVCVR